MPFHVFIHKDQKRRKHFKARKITVTGKCFLFFVHLCQCSWANRLRIYCEEKSVKCRGDPCLCRKWRWEMEELSGLEPLQLILFLKNLPLGTQRRGNGMSDPVHSLTVFKSNRTGAAKWGLSNRTHRQNGQDSESVASGSWRHPSVWNPESFPPPAKPVSLSSPSSFPSRFPCL